MTKPQIIAMFLAMIISSVLAAAGTLAGGIWWLTKSGEGLSIGGAPLTFAANEKREEDKGPSFHPLDKLVLTVKGKKQTHFVMLELAIETRQLESVQQINNYMPMIQNSMLKLFSDKTFDELQQTGAIDVLQSEVKATLLAAFEKTAIVRDIDDVLITKYVVQ